MIDLIKLAAILAVLIVLIRLKWNLGLVLLLASGLTGALFRRAFVSLARDAATAVLDPLTLQLAAIVLLIAFLGEILRSSLQLEGLVCSLTRLIADRRWLLALLPMLIGVLPMVGGAMFSAPMVDEASQGMGIGRERRTFINYWFRHAMEPVLPLYPSLVLAAGLMGVTPQRLTAAQWPLALAALCGGVAFGLVGLHRGDAPPGDGSGSKDTVVLLVRSVWPILLIVGLSLLLHVHLIIALAVTIALLVVTNRLAPRQILALARRVPLGTIPIIAGAMVFREVLENSGAVTTVANALTGLHVPVALVVFFAPFTAGLLTGLLTAAFAIGFPIGLPLAGPDLLGTGYGVLAYAGGLIGMLLSPMHLCLSLTRVYYKADWSGIYRRVIPSTLLLVVAVALVLLF